MKRCSLCGGTLDGNRRCTFCGLDNTKSDENYKHLISKSDCEHESLTHVHEEPRQNTYTLPKYTGQSAASRPAQTVKTSKVTTQKSGLRKIILIIVLIVTLGGAVIELFEINTEDYTVTEEMDYDAYEDVIYDLPEIGETYCITLEPGIYTVGTHIPEGTYSATVISGDYGMIEIRDYWNSIYLYANIGYEDEATTVEDLRLYPDGYFIVSTGIEVMLYSENVQTTELSYNANQLMEIVTVTEEMEAGQDFVPGVYDVVYEPSESGEYGNVNYTVPVEDWEYELSIFFDSEIGAEVYHNVVLPEGTLIYLEDLESVTLVPSNEIGSADSEDFYKYY